MSRKRALVIGAGVSGLTTARVLQEHDFTVRLLAEKLAPETPSVVAGALWEWPPAVCGYHTDPVSLERSKGWCLVSYAVFGRLANQPETGVTLRTSNFYFRQRLETSQRDWSKFCEMQGKVRGLRRDAALAEANGVSPDYGIQDAYCHLAPVVDTDVYTDWLLRRLRDAGCEVVQRRLHGTLKEQEQALRREFGADLIVNCSGLGAKELACDDMVPLRGALIRMINDGSRMPRIDQAHCISISEGERRQDMVYIIPRGERIVLLGGLVEPHQWSVDIGLENHPPVRDMFRRCQSFMPALCQGEIDPHEPVRVGLRPHRPGNVRLEREPGTGIIHNYGHGGSGITFSWGCAQEVARLAESA